MVHKFNSFSKNVLSDLITDKNTFMFHAHGGYCFIFKAAIVLDDHKVLPISESVKEIRGTLLEGVKNGTHPLHGDFITVITYSEELKYMDFPFVNRQTLRFYFSKNSDTALADVSQDKVTITGSLDNLIWVVINTPCYSKVKTD